MVNVIFSLANGRSGTYFLSELFRLNALDSKVVHEPILQFGNPTFFGPAIYAASTDQLDELRRLMQRKRRYIEHSNCQTYVETSHAFLKSAYRIAHEFFPDLKLVRLIRDPLYVAKSQANREMLAQRWRVPMLFYRAPDGGIYRRWGLTGTEPIFRSLQGLPLTRFQFFLAEWIAIENRAQAYVEQYGDKFTCVTIQVPEDLNQPEPIDALFKALELRRASEGLIWPRKQNRNWGVPTVLDDNDVAAARTLIAALPEQYTKQFQREPYTTIPDIQNLLTLPRPRDKSRRAAPYRR